MLTKGLQAKKQPKKRVAEAVVEKRHESDVDEDESAGWTEKVQGEKKLYDVPMKVMSIKTPRCFSEEHGWIPVMQTSQLLGCPTCYKATKLSSMYNHSRMCGVKCLQDPQLMENLEKTRQIKKADQSRQMEDANKKLLNLVKKKERIMKHHNPFGGEKTNKNFGRVSPIC
jgi:hypothetical protein